MNIQPLLHRGGESKTCYLHITNGSNQSWVLSPEDCSTWLVKSTVTDITVLTSTRLSLLIFTN